MPNCLDGVPSRAVTMRCPERTGWDCRSRTRRPDPVNTGVGIQDGYRPLFLPPNRVVTAGPACFSVDLCLSGLM